MINEPEDLTRDSRRQQLEDAWDLGVQGNYDEALAILGGRVAIDPNDVGVLRLMGNLLELKELDRLEYSSRRLASSSDYIKARSCYESILRIDPHNVMARIDLGDHFKNLDAHDQALEWYRAAVRELTEVTDRDEDWLEEVQELENALALLKNHDRLGREASDLEIWCRDARTSMPQG